MHPSLRVFFPHWPPPIRLFSRVGSGVERGSVFDCPLSHVPCAQPRLQGGCGPIPHALRLRVPAGSPPGRCVASPHTGAPCRAPPAAVRRPCWRPSAGLPSAESLGSRCWDDAEASPTPPHGGLLPRGRPALGQREPSLGPDHAAPGAGLLCPGALTSHPPRRPVRKGPAAGSEPYQGARPPGEGARPDREPPEPPRSPRARPHGPAGSPEAPPHAARTRRRVRPRGRAGLRGGRRRSLRRGCGPLPGLGSPEACRFSFFGRKQLPLF